jgi:hypothetical protein
LKRLYYLLKNPLPLFPNMNFKGSYATRGDFATSCRDSVFWDWNAGGIEPGSIELPLFVVVVEI